MAFAYAEQSTWNARKSVALLGAVAINVGFFAAIGAGLTFGGFKEQRDLELVPVPAVPKTVVPQTPQLPKFRPEAGQLTVPTPDVPPFDFEEPRVEAPEPIAGYSGDNTGSGPVVPLSPPITQLQVAKTLTPPMYPPASIRRNEQGTVRLLLYVLPNGRVSQVKIDRSSGFPLLDKAAAAAAMRDWTFRPATQGGTPIAAWGTYAVTFTLRD